MKAPLASFTPDIEIFDTTLRDGAQAEGISFSLRDKLAITALLDDMGISFIEAGNPGSNPKDIEFFREARRLKLQYAKLCAFGSTRKKNTAAASDAALTHLLDAGTETVVIFGKSSRLHVKTVLKASLEENLAMIYETVSFLRGEGRAVIYDAEHFFDGWQDSPAYALKTLRTAAAAGAERLVLCDTNGGSFPETIAAGVRAVVDFFAAENTGGAVPSDRGPVIGIHAHNDMGLAIACSLSALSAGAAHVQGTLTGAGERCGNTCLAALIPSLEIKLRRRCLPVGKLARISEFSRRAAEISNITLSGGIPYIGTSAFAHKAGMHADAILKTSVSFEHIDPSLVGNGRHFLISEMGGRSAIAERVRPVCPGITKDDPLIAELVHRLKALEADGWQFEGADASFEILARKISGRHSSFFTILSYRVASEYHGQEAAVPAGHIHSGVEAAANAWVKVLVGDECEIAAAEGDGPVNALDGALRRALQRFFPELARVRLSDYKVRVIDGNDATAAKVRVLIESTDGNSAWTTVGVSTDVIDASRKALVDGIEYKLFSRPSAK
ncbi:MAG: citramalate synthase [Spirochaetaceae bacterium]|jgi:2-isopropylmalate synthase|nr:citramalate synthase [Spirochaetaceae bacterium]